MDLKLPIALICHPETPASNDISIAVNALIVGQDSVEIEYEANGDILWPAWDASLRRDGLWQSTCLELFARCADQYSYVEYNFSPNGHWAAYRFDSYRQGMADVGLPSQPLIRVAGQRLIAQFSLPEALVGKPLDISISAVIESNNGRRSYWALRHPAGKPDFHHKDCFVLQLPPAERL